MHRFAFFTLALFSFALGFGSTLLTVFGALPIFIGAPASLICYGLMIASLNVAGEC